MGKKGERTREQLLEVAAEVFAKEGFSQTSTKTIAEEAGVSEGTIFRYFPTKKALLSAVVGPVVRKVVAPVITRSLLEALRRDHASLRDFVEAIYDDRNALVRRAQRPVRVLVQEIGVNEDLRAHIGEAFQREALPMLKQTVVDMQARGYARTDVTPSQAVRLLVTGIGGDLVLRYIVSPDTDWDEDAERAATINMLVRALEPE